LCHEQSAIDLSDTCRHVHDYSLLIMHSVLFVQKPLDILVVGLGGGVVPNQFNRYFPDARIDIVEIDSEVVHVAKSYFYLQESKNIKVYVGDAFDVLPSIKNKKYDIIVLDAFTSRYVPFHLMSKEFFNHILSLSKDKSVIVSNTSHIHPSFNSHVNTIVSILGEDICILSGLANDLTDVIYSVRGGLMPTKTSSVNLNFLIGRPEKMVITEDIKSAKIFSILCP